MANEIMKYRRTSSNDQFGEAGTGVTVVEKASGVFHVTEITIPADDPLALIEPTEAADLGGGSLLYTFPAGRCLITHAYTNLDWEGSEAVKADTPEVGLGVKVATGAVAVLSGDADFENILTGQTQSGGVEKDVDNMVVSAAASVAIETDDTDRGVYLNIADGWAAAGKVSVSGVVIIHWTAL